MKSLWRIGTRYILRAVFITFFVLCANIALFVHIGTKMQERENGLLFIRQRVGEIAEGLKMGEQGRWELSAEGQRLLEEGIFVWVMRLDSMGRVDWSQNLPPELDRDYGLGDVAVFSRWYLEDYPVITWRHQDGLLVFGMDSQDIIRISYLIGADRVRQLPEMATGFLILNIALLCMVILFFAWRFYRSLRPVGKGIEALSQGASLRLSEKGALGELGKRLNKASELIQRQREKLEQRDSARTEWIAGVSHEIRTPLALITGYSDELAKDEAWNEESRRKAEIIRSQSLLIKQLISDLNLVSRLEYNAEPLRGEPCIPAMLLRECAAEFYNRGLGENHEIELVIAPEAEKARLKGDRALLLRAFRNLMGNSIRHNPEGCLVLVRLEKTQEGVKCIFCDTGTGIPPQVIRELQKKEGRAAESGSRVHIMGLRVVWQITATHGGRMSFSERTETERGGFDVCLYLPCLTEEGI